MKSIKPLLILIVTSALLLIVVPARAQATQTPLQITEYVCMNTPGEVWQGGNLLHLRGDIRENVMVVDGEIWGINTAILNVDWNLKTGQATANAFADVALSDVNGGYAGAGAFRLFGKGPNPLISNWVGNGYGEVKGRFLRMEVAGAGLSAEGPAFCEGHGKYDSTTYWTGYILTADD